MFCANKKKRQPSPRAKPQTECFLTLTLLLSALTLFPTLPLLNSRSFSCVANCRACVCVSWLLKQLVGCNVVSEWSENTEMPNKAPICVPHGQLDHVCLATFRPLSPLISGLGQDRRSTLYSATRVALVPVPLHPLHTEREEAPGAHEMQTKKGKNNNILVR